MAILKRSRSISGKGLGEKLQQARLSQNKTLAEAEAATRIQAKYLEILEKGEYQRLPGNIYARAWIKEYAVFLGLAAEQLLSEYNLEKKISENIGRVGSFKAPTSPKGNVFLQPRILKRAAIVLVIATLFIYLFWELSNIIKPPLVLIVEPANNFITKDSQVSLVGQTETEVELFINGERVLIDGDGKFSQTVNLVGGLNKFKISAKKKHSQTRYLEWDILRQIDN